jgi:hypothetical protein
MPIQFVLLPLFVEVALTFGLLWWMGIARARDLRSGAVHPRDIALGEDKWTPRTIQIANCFSNQFEAPVLFYVLTILSIMTRHADIIFVVLAWVFVVCRLIHAYVHTTSNVVSVRGRVYGVGVLALMIAWIVFAVRILLGLP